MSDGFVAGFAARHAVAATLLQQAFAPPSGFAARCPTEARAPRHFSPADPDRNPTAGWDPLDAGAPHLSFLLAKPCTQRLHNLGVHLGHDAILRCCRHGARLEARELTAKDCERLTRVAVVQ